MRLVVETVTSPNWSARSCVDSNLAAVEFEEKMTPPSTTPIKEIKTTLEGVGHILSDRRLAVPPYQRSYAWEERQTNDLFQDLDTAMRDGLDEYFLGSIVLIRERADPDRPQLVDGQQRRLLFNTFANCGRRNTASRESGISMIALNKPLRVNRPQSILRHNLRIMPVCTPLSTIRIMNCGRSMVPRAEGTWIR